VVVATGINRKKMRCEIGFKAIQLHRACLYTREKNRF